MLKLVTLLDQIYKILDLQTKKNQKVKNKNDDEGRREKIKKSQK